MYLKAIKMTNYRKYGEKNNRIEFVDADAYTCMSNQSVNVASTVTLVVGKNNAGKTTIVKVLNKLINNKNFCKTDFNMNYMRRLLKKYVANDFSQLPYMEFEVIIGLDKGVDDYITNISKFLSIGATEKTEQSIIIRYEIGETAKFESELRKVYEISTVHEKKDHSLDALLNLIEENSSLFQVNYYDETNKIVKDFRLNQLIEYVPVEVSNIESGNALSLAFNKIVKYRYNQTFQLDKKAIKNQLESINDTLTKSIEDKHTKEINDAITQIVSDRDVQVNLAADITFQKLMEGLIKYEYVEGDNHIPENQFGLGYSNLMMIIASVIDYIEKKPVGTAFNSKINLISIEEPETHMHPQMQELFIQYINDAINVLLKDKEKQVNCQLLITTHSSHIVNSKIQSGGTVDNINYIDTRDNEAYVVVLKDQKITPLCTTAPKDELRFIKNHMKFGFSDTLFADAVFLVEGLTEEILIPYYLSKDENLKHKYIKVVKIDGAHAFVYKEFLETIGIPAAVITDLDIKRTDVEKKAYTAIKSLAGKTTTNNTIIKFHGNSDDLTGIVMPLESGNIGIFFQENYEGYEHTSFEEAYIACNYDNETVNKVLKEIKPNIYNEIVGVPANYTNNKVDAYKWQRKLSDDKSKFANALLYRLLVDDQNIPKLPSYIVKAFAFIKKNV